MASNGYGTSGIEFLAGGGDMGALIRGHDWAATPLGVAAGWPQSLKTAVRIMLTSQQPIWIGWGDGLTYLYNDAYRSIIGGKHPWALGHSTAEVWREIWDEIEPLLNTAMQGDAGIYVEEQLLIMERNGYPEETYYTFSYSPIPDDDGSPGGIICANTDDTRRVIGERQLALLRDIAARTARARDWRDACRLGIEVLATRDHDLPFAAIYAAEEDDAGALVRIAATGIAGDDPAVPARLMPDTERLWPIARALAERQAVLVEADALPAAVAARWSRPVRRAAVYPIVSAEGGRTALLVVGLSPVREFDESYSSFLDLLAGQLATAIGNAEAYARERARAEALAELDRAKTVFFSNVSHEFRTPLTLMLGPLEEVLGKPDGGVLPDNRALVDVAHRNGLRLMRLVNALLDFSRIEAGRIQANYVATDLGGFTGELVSSFRSACAQAGLTLEADVPPQAQPGFVDRAMWETIVLNLMSNAFKFTLEGGIAVRLADHDGGFRLMVRDTGSGIPADEMPRLFERFHRVAGQAGRSFEGSGIGLALVQELVNLHGGTVSAESVVGQGTVFIVDLPGGHAHLPHDRVGGDADGPASPTRADAFVEEAMRWLPDAGRGELAPPDKPAGGAGRVLLADDNGDMRAYVARLLEAEGFAVEAVADGAAALASARIAAPDLVLTDIMMPKLDGFGLLRAIRDDPALIDLPVVMLSARAGEEAEVEGLAAGADDYLVKPFSARELVARVTANLTTARVRREAAAALADESRILATLNRTGAALSGELAQDRVVQMVTDAGVELTGAAFGAFSYAVGDETGDSDRHYTLSGVERSAFEDMEMLRDAAIFGPSFDGQGIVRLDDMTADPRYGTMDRYHGMGEGFPVRSYLAVPVLSRSGAVLGRLFFGHSEPGRFDARHEALMSGLAGQAATAIDNARLFEANRRELAQRREAEAELTRLNATLEERVAEEVARRGLAEEALRQAQKMEAVGQLTGGIAHDFNNLLTVVTGNIDMAGRALTAAGVTDARSRRALDNAMRGADRAASLTQRLLAFSRRQPLMPRPTDVDRLVLGMSDLLHRALGETVQLEIVTLPGLWRVEVDANQLESAILNLAVNARDAMAAGGRLTIETANARLDEGYAATQAEVAPGQYVVILVTDTGSGMSRETVERVFEPFFTTKDVGKGTGLGLSMVYGFVKQSGGHVKVYSEEGHGTTVKIYLPRLISGEVVDGPEPSQSYEASSGQETIMVVEDDDDVRAYTVGSLRELNYRVLEAHDGPAALRLLARQAEAPDLLFTDVVMPGMSGRELAEIARVDLPRLKVLYTSGYTRNAIVHGGRLDPGVEMIAKPFTFAALARKVRDVLDAGATRRVLVVAGAAASRNGIAEILTHAGYAVEQAATAIETLGKARAAQVRYDVIVIEARGGEGLAAELRALHADLPILLVGQTADCARFTPDRCTGVLAHPFDETTLTATLEALGVRCRGG